jgi:cbb3-type cytochrome oxidase maturation protein
VELFLVLIPITVILVAFSLWGFVWSARNDQFDDLEKQAYSILFDDDDNTQLAKTPERDDE